MIKASISDNNLLCITLTEDECNNLRSILAHANYDMEKVSSSFPLSVGMWETLRTLYYKLTSADFHNR
jgi:hypothetical protein